MSQCPVRRLLVSPVSQKRTLAEQLSGAFVVFGALVASAFFVTAVTYAICWMWLTPEFQRSHLAMQNESAAHSAMLNEEDGLRGYLLTRNTSFLEPYASGEMALNQANLALLANIGSVPSAEIAVAMVRTRTAEERWHEQWASPAADTRPGLIGPAMADGKALFDVYRSAQAAFADALSRRRDSLSEREQRVILGRVALELGVFFAVLLLAMRQHRTLRAAIVDPVAALLRHIRRIRDGQLEATADLDGPRELAELALELNELVRALAIARESAVSRDGALSEHAIRLHQILDASREFSESLNLAYVVDSVRASTVTIGGYERVIVWLMDETQKRLIDGQQRHTAAVVDDPTQMRGVAGRAAKSGRITFEGPAGQVRFGDSSVMPVQAIAVPLVVGARVVGVLEARHTHAQSPTKDALEVLEMLATHAATAIESARLHEVIEERSQVDALTHLLNRRRLDEDLDAECKRCARYGRPLAFVMLDVDHFKAFNDAHGHPRADTALQGVADVITGCVRTTDTAYRYGGEEFCILLRETCAQDALHFAERVRQRIEQRFATGEMAGITASFGVADFTPDAPTPRALVEAADAAMYESKHSGRNRVALSVRPAPPSAEPRLAT
jgi:diguanylate cyclase (GGDEF)-like protein